MSTNTFTNLDFTELGNQVLVEFNRIIAPLSMLSRNLSSQLAPEGASVKVPFVARGSGAIEWDGSYKTQGSNVSSKLVTMNKRPYVNVDLTTQELRDNPQLDYSIMAQSKANELAQHVFEDILSVVTAANYGDTDADKLTVAAANFDSDDLVDLRKLCQDAKWPMAPRGFIMNSEYGATLLKDDALKDASASGSTATLRQGSVGRLSDFDIFEVNILPSNSENLAGFGYHPDGILMAGRALEPEDTRGLLDFQVLTMEQGGGLPLVYREWFDANTDTTRRVIEANYGFDVGNSAAIKRMVTA